jgi:hypothetical protein
MVSARYRTSGGPCAIPLHPCAVEMQGLQALDTHSRPSRPPIHVGIENQHGNGVPARVASGEACPLRKRGKDLPHTASTAQPILAFGNCHFNQQLPHQIILWHPNLVAFLSFPVNMEEIPQQIGSLDRARYSYHASNSSPPITRRSRSSDVGLVRGPPHAAGPVLADLKKKLKSLPPARRVLTNKEIP